MNDPVKLPRGPRKRHGETVRSVGRWKKVISVLMLGIIAGILVQPIRSEANSLCGTIQYEDGIPENIRIDCEDVGAQFDICPELLEAMAYHESRFIPTVRNGKHYGLMQINVKIHADRLEKYGYTVEDMYDPYKNLIIAADYMAELYDIYGDDNPIVLSIYSGNWKAVSAYKEYGFMTNYVDWVLTKSAEYERLHGK